MKDQATKKVGPYHSTSRNWERAMKRRTVKFRRQQSKHGISCE